MTSTRTPRLFSIALSLSLVAALTALAPISDAGAKTKFRRSASFGPIPVKGDCLGNTSPGGCIWNARETDFALSSHIVHVGGHISGTGTSVFAQKPITNGAGLKLTHKRVTPGKGFTATWDAVSDTGTAWQYGVGIEISLLADHPSYLESDYYAVVDKRAAILEGHVRDLAKLPVPGMEVLIDGRGSVADENLVATTAYDGYYAAKLKPGSYRVCMRDVKDDGSIGREQCALSHVVAPAKRSVTVRAKKTATADFVVQNSPRTTIKLAQSSVPATGLDGTTMTVRTLNRWGKADPNQEVLISPNVRGSAAADLAVPALVCDATSGTRWPQADPTSISARDPFKARTDTAGMYEATIAAGTIGGPWTISARNVTTDSPRGYATTTLTVTPEAGQPLPALRTAVNDGIAGGSVPTLASFGAADNDQVLLSWVLALRALPIWHGVDIIPIAGFAANQRAVLLAPAGAVKIDPAGNITGDIAQARILEPTGGGSETAKQEVAMGGSVGQLPVNWSGADWVAGTSPGLSPAARGAARVLGFVFTGRRYGGFPYPTGAAKACT